MANLTNRGMVVPGVAVVAIIAFFFLAPIIPVKDNPLQLAGFFPRYESVTCALAHVGAAYGPDSFSGMKWVLGACG